MDINNMKVTDLKKELKSRGLSIVGIKSELMARLAAAMDGQSGEGLEANNGDNENEDSVLSEDHNEEELLAEESVNDCADTKADDNLIDDLLDTNNETKPKPIVTSKKVIRNTFDNIVANDVKKAVGQTPVVTNTADPSLSPKLLKTTNTIRLSVDEKKELRAQKFGDNKLSERAQRFGLKAADSTETKTESKTQSNTNSTSVDDKLKKRAQRFGAIVSETLKKSEDNQRLDKRKERFSISKTTTTASAKTPATENTNSIQTLNANSKRKITFSTKDDDRKEKRIARFGTVS